ncbi:hypothetical protein [Kitasatospora sp. NPDC097643]|uniref:hypothetical protein n=1 Tax=Kitasatospora sp. NPDC097643 TaxID=3157230 RepID=UPI00332DEA95
MALRTPRRIRVDDRDYRWVVRHVDCGHVAVRIWLDGPGRPGRQLVVTREFDDPWLHFGELLTAPADRVGELFQLDPVTPSLTADLVRAGLDAGWRPEEAGAPLRCAMVGERAGFTLVRED